MARDCPKPLGYNQGVGRDRQPAATRRDRVADASGTVSAFLRLFHRLIFDLFNSGATHSLISYFIDKYSNTLATPLQINYHASIIAIAEL